MLLLWHFLSELDDILTQSYIWCVHMILADECMLLFGCSSVLTVVSKRKAKFLDDYLQSYNILCRLFAHVADKENRNCNAALEL